jgi:ATP-dependent helicase HrpA
VPVNAFREDALPIHLRMNFVVVDEFNKVVERSRELQELKVRRSSDARQTFSVLAEQAYLHTGCKSWTFGVLPERFEGRHDGLMLHGFPALVDEGDSVGVRVFDTQEEANHKHPIGLARLFRLTLAKELKYLKKNLAVNVQAERVYRQLSAHPFLYSGLKNERDLREDLLDRLMGALFLEGQPDIRSLDDFEQRIKTHQGNMILKADEMAKTAQTLLQAYSEIQAKLKISTKNPALNDIQQQLGVLVYAGFWVTTPYTQIREMPRYLKAILNRLEKAPQDPLRDQKQYQEIAPFLKRYWDAIKVSQGKWMPEYHPFRWMLEEFRVSLFAQTLKTAYPVSAKRMEDAWKQTGLKG